MICLKAVPASSSFFVVFFNELLCHESMNESLPVWSKCPPPRRPPWAAEGPVPGVITSQLFSEGSHTHMKVFPVPEVITVVSVFQEIGQATKPLLSSASRFHNTSWKQLERLVKRQEKCSMFNLIPAAEGFPIMHCTLQDARGHCRF